jgi:hypothetical protein
MILRGHERVTGGIERVPQNVNGTRHGRWMDLDDMADFVFGKKTV